jgi:SAM-dependent methyltransferase
MGSEGHDPYDPQYFAATFAAEDRHFWFRYRNDIIEHFARSVWTAKGGRVLEVGCGTGNVLRALGRACPDATVVGLELFPEGLRFARQRVSTPLVCGRIEQLPFSTRFSMIGLFDVLEHLTGDRAALGHLRDQLEPGGVLLLTVPAHQSLWSRFDEASGHVRRYERRPLRRLLEESGFDVEYLSAFMLPLFPAVWLNRRVAGRGSRQDAIDRELAVPGPINAVLTGILKLERPWLAARRSLPFGTSLFAVARKPQR